MNYRLRLFWNDTMVCDATCTAVVACDLGRAHIYDQFAGQRLKEFLSGMDVSYDTVRALVGQNRLDYTYGDETGWARVLITRKSVN